MIRKRGTYWWISLILFPLALPAQEFVFSAHGFDLQTGEHDVQPVSTAFEIPPNWIFEMDQMQEYSTNGNLLSGNEAFAESDSTPEPLVYLNFDGDVLDKSGNGFHGKKMGGSFVEDRNGNPKSALRLDGIDDYVSFGIVPEFQISTGMTVMAWVKLDSLAFVPLIFQNSFIENSNTGLNCFVSYLGTAGITLGDGKSVGTNSRKTFSSDVMVKREEWIHLAFLVVAENSMKIILNGEVLTGVYSGNGDGLRYHPAGESLIGKTDTRHETNKGEYYFRGEIDEFKLFARPLSEQEVKNQL